MKVHFVVAWAATMVVRFTFLGFWRWALRVDVITDRPEFGRSFESRVHNALLEPERESACDLTRWPILCGKGWH